MITIISGTNRPDSNTENIASNIQHLAEKQGIKAINLSLKELPDAFMNPSHYGNPPESFSQILKERIESVDRFIFILPEYNGSYPGIAKLFLDVIHPKTWQGKKAALVGVSTGRAGNLRGLDHFAAVLNYLKMEVYSQKIPLSQVHENLDSDGVLSNPEYTELLTKQIESLKTF